MSDSNKIVPERMGVYGDPINTFTRIAKMWSAMLDHEVQPWMVPLLMNCLKMIRTAETPDYSDNSDDQDGYLDIFRKLVPDMIHARSVDEYIGKKFPMNLETELTPKPVQMVVPELEPINDFSSPSIIEAIAAAESDGYNLVGDAVLRGEANDRQRCISMGHHLAFTQHTRAHCPAEKGINAVERPVIPSAVQYWSLDVAPCREVGTHQISTRHTSLVCPVDPH